MSDYEATAAEVKALREVTGAGIMECKNALRESGGDQDAAVKLEGIDLVLEGEAAKVTDRATLERVAGRYRESGWPAEVEGEAPAPAGEPAA